MEVCLRVLAHYYERDQVVAVAVPCALDSMSFASRLESPICPSCVVACVMAGSGCVLWLVNAMPVVPLLQFERGVRVIIHTTNLVEGGELDESGNLIYPGQWRDRFEACMHASTAAADPPLAPLQLPVMHLQLNQGCSIHMPPCLHLSLILIAPVHNTFSCCPA